MKAKVYILDDDRELNEILTTYLKKEDWEVRSFYSGEEVLKAIDDKPHIWILDIMLPDTDGFYIIKKIREKTPNVPVIFISARDQILDRVLGLEMGSDDYIAKPFMPRELVIRVKKLFDRCYTAGLDIKDKTYIIDGYEIDEGKRRVRDGSRLIELTSKEMELVLVLASSNGRAFTRDDILNMVWGQNYFGSDRVVDDLVRRLRKKMPRIRIETVYGHGYRLVI